MAFVPAPPLLVVGGGGRVGRASSSNKASPWNNNKNILLPSGSVIQSTPLYTTSMLQARGGGKKAKSSSSSSSSSLIPNPFHLLPWNVERETKRRARKFRRDRSELHRYLGIAEDATYEEIVDATNVLIARADADGDIKRKIQIEVTKDKILQIRLNERLAGLTSASTEAKAQSSYEVDG